MVIELGRASLAVGAARSDPQAVLGEPRLVLRVEAVVVVERLGRVSMSVDRGDTGAGDERDRMRLPGKRAGERLDQQPLGVGARLGVFSVSVPENGARELDRDVLEAASGADERHVLLAGVADRVERSLHAAIRARRRDEDGVEAVQPLGGMALAILGRHPLEIGARMLERGLRPAICRVTGSWSPTMATEVIARTLYGSAGRAPRAPSGRGRRS